MAETSSPCGLHRLIYASRFSRNFPAPIPAQDHEIRGIISASLRHNRQVSVTGMILVTQEHFLQALEGPAEAVIAAYTRILCDRRHDTPRLLYAGAADRRHFGAWAMCARRLSEADESVLGPLGLTQALDPMDLGPASSLKLLDTVRDIQHGVCLRAIA